MGRCLGTRLSKMYPYLESHVKKEQGRQAASHNVHAREKHFGVGDRVYVQKFSRMITREWVPAVVISVSSPVSYTCFSQLGERRYHVDQIRSRESEFAQGAERASRFVSAEEGHGDGVIQAKSWYSQHKGSSTEG